MANNDIDICEFENIDNTACIPLFCQVIIMLFPIFQELLNYTEHGYCSIFTRFTTINNLLNVSRKHFQHLKKENFYYKLSQRYSFNYYVCQEFREQILSLTNIRKQLSLRLCNREFSDVSVLSNVHHLILNKCPNIVDVSPLSECHILNLSDCKNVVNVSHLGNVFDLDLSINEKIRDVSALGRVNTLNLTSCEKVRDISALGDVQNLDLTWDEDIIDFSALGRVRVLNLSYCKTVIDVSALGNVNNLDLSECHNLIDVSALQRVHILNLR